jgi:3-oxoacyl-[acyl-carrier protein] reductase
MHIAAVARDASNLEQLTREIAAQGGRSIALPHDLRDRNAAGLCVQAAASEFGRLDLVVNNAGDSRNGTLLEVNDDDWANVFELKLFGYIRMSRAAWPLLRQSSGSIIHIIGSNSRAGKSHFTIGGATNAALVNITKSMADLGQTDGVRVNAVNPGLTLTGRWQTRLQALAKEKGVSVEEASRQVCAQWGVLRFAEASEIANLVTFLASGAASYVQGSIVDIDGGYNRAV